MIDKEIKSVELVTIKKGLHKVLVNWFSDEQSAITFYTKKEAERYLEWLSGEPKTFKSKI